MFEVQKRFVQNLESDLFFVMRMTVEEFEAVLKDYITEKQLFDLGIDGKSKKLRAYERTTILIKASKGQPFDRTTLKDTGAFHNSIKVEAYADNMQISSDVPYDRYLIDPRESKNAYGFDVLKPTDMNMRDFITRYFLPNLKKFINDRIAR